MRVARARQTPERRREIGILGGKASRGDWWVRFLARLKVYGDTEEQRCWLAYQYGKGAAKSQRYRERKARAA